jgi:hypothetical protein
MVPTCQQGMMLLLSHLIAQFQAYPEDLVDARHRLRNGLWLHHRKVDIKAESSGFRTSHQKDITNRGLPGEPRGLCSLSR